MLAPRRGVQLVLLVTAVVLSAAAPAPALAQPAAPTATSRQKEMQARKAFAAGEWKQALALFADLYAETLHPVYLRNIGRCHQKLRDPDRAIDAFRDYLAKNKKVTADERTEIQGYIKEMETLRAELSQQNEAPSLPASPGPTGPDLSPRPPVPPGPAVEVSTVPEPAADTPIYKRWWFWTGVGVVVVGGVVAAVAISRSSGGDVCPSGVNCAGMP
jgi:hypothetical protein